MRTTVSGSVLINRRENSRKARCESETRSMRSPPTSGISSGGCGAIPEKTIEPEIINFGLHRSDFLRLSCERSEQESYSSRQVSSTDGAAVIHPPGNPTTPTCNVNQA